MQQNLDLVLKINNKKHSCSDVRPVKLNEQKPRQFLISSQNSTPISNVNPDIRHRYTAITIALLYHKCHISHK